MTGQSHTGGQTQERLDRLLHLLELNGGPGDELEVADAIRSTLLEAGVDASCISTDAAHRKIGTGGCGNLIVRLPGRGPRTPRRLLSAHMDTVPLCVGNTPYVDGDSVRGQDATKALGGDDRSGCAVLLNAACELMQSDSPHPPITFLWTVQEEVGLRGARCVTQSKLGKPSLGFNFDGRAPESMVIGATGDVGVDITIHGLASHAGVKPQAGVSAASVFASALASLDDGGWHGLIEKGRQSGTSNVGVLGGGAATNVVMDALEVRAEVRSHSPKFRNRILSTWRRAFELAAQRTTSCDGEHASITWADELKYEAFRLKASDEVVRLGRAAIEAAGLTPDLVVGNGGLDANWLVAHGIPTVTFGCGQHDIHTTSEWLHIPSFLNACDVAATLVRGG